MLEISRIREQKDWVVGRLKVRNLDAVSLIDRLLETDSQWRDATHQLQESEKQSNELAKEVGKLFAAGKKEEAETAKAKSAELKQTEKDLKEKVSGLSDNLQKQLYELPNLPNEIVPSGKSAEDNQIVFESGTIVKLPDSALPHWDLAAKYKLIDFELGVKVTGAGFPFYTGQGARLQRSLINFFLDQARDAGYQEVIAPFVVNEASGYGTGQLPDKEGQMYHVGSDDFYLIPTAEVPLTNMYRDVILSETELPVALTGYTPCFRREAGSYGKDVRGLNRLHQFDKVEIVRIEKPENSYEALDEMVEYVKGLLDKLELPFRTLRLCGGDMGFTSALTYDMEVYSAAQKKWLEVSSVSNFETFQANRLKLRLKDAQNKKRLAHTLNGSALALPRIMAALLENNQTEKDIRIPKILVPYTGFDVIR